MRGRKQVKRRRELADALREAQQELTAALDLVVVASCGSLERDDEHPEVAAAWEALAEEDELNRAYERFTQAAMAAAQRLREES